MTQSNLITHGCLFKSVSSDFCRTLDARSWCVSWHVRDASDFALSLEFFLRRFVLLLGLFAQSPNGCRRHNHKGDHFVHSCFVVVRQLWKLRRKTKTLFYVLRSETPSTSDKSVMLDKPCPRTCPFASTSMWRIWRGVFIVNSENVLSSRFQLKMASWQPLL